MLERVLAAQQLVQHHAQAEDIGPAVDQMPFATGLLRTHIGGGTRQSGLGGNLVFGQSQAEVRQVRTAGGVDQDVGRLDVAVVDLVLVEAVQGLGDGQHEFDGAAERQPLFRLQIAQVAAFDQLHGQIRLAVHLAKVQQGNDCGMLEAARGPGLTRELFRPALADLRWRVCQPVAADDFEGDLLLPAFVPGPVDRAHAALAQDRADRVLAQPFSGRQRGGGQWFRRLAKRRPHRLAGAGKTRQVFVQAGRLAGLPSTFQFDAQQPAQQLAPHRFGLRSQVVLDPRRKTGTRRIATSFLETIADRLDRQRIIPGIPFRSVGLVHIRRRSLWAGAVKVWGNREGDRKNDARRTRRQVPPQAELPSPRRAIASTTILNRISYQGHPLAFAGLSEAARQGVAGVERSEPPEPPRTMTMGSLYSTTATRATIRH